eukprot:TRINITY_DN19734_c0_g1_i2.p1 TRINITY_DN19734_c0_g1~~TRINITY_DN19734_c0_g1_i2.p1  ORF type:complete len:488 (-),score=109.04 TRINITY_DN19734_c0_g1_i2:277-1740(-)
MAPEITSSIRAAIPRKDARVYILGDTSYSPCCVDEVAAQHMKADLVVHLGASCLTPSSRLPVYHMFGRSLINPAAVGQAIVSGLKQGCVEGRLLLVADHCHSHGTEEMARVIRESYPALEAASVAAFFDPKNPPPCQGSSVTTSGWRYDLGQHDISEWTVVFVGEQTAGLSNFMLTQQAKGFYRYEPEKDEWTQETPRTNQTLMKRYYFIERARRVKFFGILVGTLGAACYMDIIKRLKKMITESGRKAKVFLVGKINIPKLANFAEVEAYVLVGCPLSTLMDSKEYTVPIITPFELECALWEDREWDGRYDTDFRSLLDREFDPARLRMPTSKNGASNKGTIELTMETDPSCLGESDGELLEASKLPQGLLSRSFQGLVVGLSNQPAAKIQQGQHGIARGYTTEDSVKFTDAGCAGKKPVCCKNKTEVETEPEVEHPQQRAPPRQRKVHLLGQVRKDDTESSGSELELDADARAELGDAFFETESD